MAEKKAFLLRLDARIFDALQKWAADDLRSANAQIEFLLRGMLQKAGRLEVPKGAQAVDDRSNAEARRGGGIPSSGSA
jgi:hypothetical protein